MKIGQKMILKVIEHEGGVRAVKEDDSKFVKAEAAAFSNLVEKLREQGYVPVSDDYESQDLGDIRFHRRPKAKTGSHLTSRRLAAMVIYNALKMLEADIHTGMIKKYLPEDTAATIKMTDKRKVEIRTHSKKMYEKLLLKSKAVFNEVKG